MKTEFLKESIIRIFCVTITIFFLSSMSCPAFVALPKEAGINYQTMKVIDASKLRANGMKKVQNGDAVTVNVGKDGGLLITDGRTGETIKWIDSKK
jgi:hypothetical protein